MFQHKSAAKTNKDVTHCLPHNAFTLKEERLDTAAAPRRQTAPLTETTEKFVARQTASSHVRRTCADQGHDSGLHQLPGHERILSTLFSPIILRNGNKLFPPNAGSEKKKASPCNQVF